jgi:3-hydroxybutyryl-CoA dehydrogenase
MGRGIAQIAAQSGCFVWLHDTQRSVCEAAISALGDTWERLRERGKLTDTDRETYRSRLGIADKLADLQGCDLVIEAVVERVDIKQQLFRQLEDIVSDTAVLATNTSSLSVTQIASVLKRPERFAGYHFLTPFP